MRIEMQKGKPKLQTFDSTIKYSSTEDKFSSGRQEDINNHMCESMGVSKAILNNVIFCHQEDSNWPLDEGKKLKEKFDAIFGTSEYNKAIKKFSNIKKAYEIKLKEAIFDKKLQEDRKFEVERKERSIMDIQNKFKAIQKEYEEYEQKLAPLNAKKEQNMMKEKDYTKLVVEKKSYEAT